MGWQTKYQEWQQSQELEKDLQYELSMLTELNACEDRFYKYLDFGTGGMRGELGVGINRMNTYTIRRVAKALGLYLNRKLPMIKQKHVVISYDNRYYSKVFAQWTARMLANEGIHIFLADQMRPTPELSFLVRAFSAQAGVMITASHNPKQYNGFKVYGSDGGQITLDTAQELTDILATLTNELLLFAPTLTSFVKNGMIEMFGETADQAYINQLDSVIQNQRNVFENGKNIRILYTPLHGSGANLVPQSFTSLGFTNLHIVSNQADGDPGFSTVESPNPEDPHAFEQALKEAEKQEPDLLFATDPDADRLGVVLFDKGSPVYLTGNEIGALLLDFLINQKKGQNNLSDFFIAKTIVTSELGAKIAEDFGIETRNTLTGFKFIGEQIELAEQNKNKKFLFGYEESFGYLIAPFVRDKDAVQAAVLMSELTLTYKQNNQTPLERLEALYKEYGYYVDRLKSIEFLGKSGFQKMQQMLTQLRRMSITEIGNYSVEKVEDYLYGIAYNLVNHTESTLSLPKSDVLKYHLADGSWFCIRPSGTEPKCKIYVSAQDESREKAQAKLQKLLSGIDTLLSKTEES